MNSQFRTIPVRPESTRYRHSVSGRESTCSIFNIQYFSINDGPGIRSTLFMKGCPLRCPWCSNPESLSSQVQIKIAPEKCRGCGSCLEVCDPGALTLKDNRIFLDSSLCTGCMKCTGVCQYGGITSIGTTVTIPDALDLLTRDESFYRHTNGGVTVSGGEPLLQHDSLAALLQLLRIRGIHTALDTTGHAPGDHFEQILAYVDLVLYDIKHLDSQKHRLATGVGNGLILENLAQCSGRTEIWLRTPLIPGFNDEFALTDDIVNLADTVGASRCCFLPFHRWGEHKYARLGMPNSSARFREWRPKEIDGFKSRYESRQGFVFFETSG